MSEDRTNCIIGARPHIAGIGHLCDDHLQRLATMLRDIEDETAIISVLPSMQARPGRGATLASQRSPAVLEAIVATDPRRGTAHLGSHDHDPWGLDSTASVLATLNSWARIVRGERGLTTNTPATVSGERDLLSRHLAWIASQSWVGKCYADLRALLGQLRATNHTGPDRPHSACPVLIDGQPCTGQVWTHDELQPVWRIHPDRCARTWEQAPGPAVCDTCGATWKTNADKARLERMISDAAAEIARPRTHDGRAMRTAAELAAEHGITVNNVRVIAHRSGIPSAHGHYDPAIFRRDAASAS